MNYYEARQSTVDKTWAWSVRNDDDIWFSDPCTKDCKHATAAEAERHWYDWETERAKRFEISDQQRKCEHPSHANGSLFWCSTGMECRIGPRAMLCEVHLTVAGLRETRPFKEGIWIAASW